ncbi:MAG: 50S ribosomal protein L25/general stress protein Ctc [Bilophila sp.]
MSELKTLPVQQRSGFGKGANRRIRLEDLVPGVYYSTDGVNIAVQVPARPLAKLFSQVGRTTVFNLEIDNEGTKAIHPVLVWQTQRHPVKSTFTHVDFYGVDLHKPVKITVPVEFIGIARGTKVGGKLETYRDQVQLVAKPLEMPAKVVIDVTTLDVGSHVQITDVALPDGVVAAFDTNYVICSVIIPGAEDEEGAAATSAAE